MVKEFYKKTALKIKKRYKNFVIKISKWYEQSFKTRVKKASLFIKNLLLNTHFDFIFIFLASYILIIDYTVVERLFFSVGISYLYHLVTSDYYKNKLLINGGKR